MQSLRAIIKQMDPVEKPQSLLRLIDMHRWRAGEIFRTLGEVSRRHNDPRSRVLRLLWYNTFLVPGFNAPPLPRIGAAPDREERAREIGATIRDNQYNLVALSEVFESASSDAISAAFSGIPGVTAVQGPAAGGTTSGWLHYKSIPFGYASVTRISSGLLTIARSIPIIAMNRLAFRERGDRERDADAYANKGVLHTRLDVAGVGQIDLYTTHLFAGGGVPLKDAPTEDERHRIRMTQVAELVSFINATSSPDNIALVAGDFNINGRESRFYADLVAQMDGVKERGCEDLWTARNGALGPTSNIIERGSAICSPASDDGRYCSDDMTIPPPPGSRIDYVFLERQAESHPLIVDAARPRRVPFRRSAGSASPPFLSDHIGLEIDLIISPRR